jgi:hypothetical protein
MGRLLFVLALTISVLAGLGLAGQEQVSAQGEVVTIDPADQEVARGEMFSVDVMISGAENLYSYEFTLAFDPDLVEVQDVADASFLGSTGRAVVEVGPDIGDGTVTFSALTTGMMDGPDGSGTLATVTFQAIGQGTSALKLEDVTVYSGTEEREPMVEDGSVTSVFAMAIDPEESIVNPGTFTVDVVLHGGLNLTGYEFNLAFDPDVLQVDAVADASFLGSTGRTVVPGTPEIDNTAGTLFFGAVSAGTMDGPDGRGTLATITFSTADYGETKLDLSGLSSFSGGTPETPDDMDGMVYVVRAGVSVVPEASSVSNCDTFDVELALGGVVEDVTGFDINLDWDTALFEVMDITFAPYLESTGRTAQQIAKVIDNTTGTLNYAVATVGTAAGPDAPGVLAVVTLHALDVGISDLDLEDVMISQSGFEVEPAALYDGTAEATPEAVGFEFSTIASPQVAGQSFMVTITAVDEFGDPAQHFSGMVSLSDTTGTLAPTMVEFEDGTPAVMASMSITKAEAGITISAEGTNPCGVTITGQSNAFEVEPDILNPAGVTIDPDDVTLEAGECQLFTLEGVDGYGNTFDATSLAGTTFSADGGGTMTGNEFCAETVGDWTVTGTYLTVSDEADVTVEPGPVTRVEVMPSEATLMPMETQLFAAMCYDAFDNENVADCTPTWSVADADAGSIDASGLFTAAMPGDYPAAVVATVDSVTGTADVTVEPFHLFMPIIMNNYSP